MTGEPSTPSRVGGFLLPGLTTVTHLWFTVSCQQEATSEGTPMGRRRDHYPRFHNVCPDPDACERFGHYEGVTEGDTCECCGQTVKGGRYVAELKDYGRYETWIVRDTDKGGIVAVASGVVVPGTLTEAEARGYADRLNGVGK